MRSVTGLPIFNAAQRQSFDALLSPLPTVSLEQVNQRARMMSRMDRKYVLSSDQCAGILAQLPDETSVMGIGGALSQRYESVYFDTCGLDSYLSAAYGRRKRFKLRTRTCQVIGGIRRSRIILIFLPQPDAAYLLEPLTAL